MESVNATVVYYSPTGTVHTLAQAAAEAVEKAGARLRVRKVAEPAPPEAIDAVPAWSRHLQDTGPSTPSIPRQRRTAVAPGALADKVYSAFTASGTAHGDQESTLLALGNTFRHWGGIIVAPGYTDPVQFTTGNPYGASHVTGDGPPDDVTLAAVHHQDRRAVDTATALKAGRTAMETLLARPDRGAGDAAAAPTTVR